MQLDRSVSRVGELVYKVVEFVVKRVLGTVGWSSLGKEESGQWMSRNIKLNQRAKVLFSLTKVKKLNTKVGLHHLPTQFRMN